MDLATKLFKEVKSPIIGLSFTKHFWERYVERFKFDLTPLEGLMKKIDAELIFLIYEAEKRQPHSTVVIKHNGAKIPLVLIHNEYPELKAVTI